MMMEGGKAMDQTIPQWKKDLILKRRAVGRVLPTESGSVQLTCPNVVAAVRFAEYSISPDFDGKCESEREQTSGCKNMRLKRHVSASDDFAEPCIILDIKEIITKIQSASGKNSKMGEEKSAKKVNSSPLISDKKSNDNDTDDNASDSSEEFKYGPGIVSKLKSKYLSLTLRESQGRVRPTLDSLRRAASLENIPDAPETEKIGEYKSNYLRNFQSSVNGSTPQRCRGLSRINKDSMKRARSVEVLTGYDRFHSANNQKILNLEKENSDNRKIKKRISSSSVEEKELPPPDVVKHTLKLFETAQNQTSVVVKKKNQKNASDCAKKPAASQKPFFKQNSVDKAVKISPEIVNDFYSKKISKKTKGVNSSPEKMIVNECEHSGMFEKKIAALLKEKTSEIVMNKTLAKDIMPDKETGENVKKNTLSLQSDLSIDLTDTAIFHPKRTSPVTSTSPKSSDKSIESPEAKRCISPVLVRAPPCILSSELNSPSSPGQQMKQVGVIRPIVTNKIAHSNVLKQPLKTRPHLTEREIEKNLINKVKSIEQPVTKVIVSLKKSPDECFVENNEKIKPIGSLKKGEFWDKKPNTMVFNFSNRKTVPDYIENDGLILASRKEKPKLGESGVIYLGGGTEDSSTDFDSEEASELPLLCDIVFEGDNILINGKSNIQSKPKLRKMKIQFNDEATTLFEYPSEASLLDQPDETKVENEVFSSGSSSPALPNPFRNLASYIPSKLFLSTDFQLGVTKAALQQPPSPNAREPEQQEHEEEYLRPADETTTLSWSAETATDLLF